MQVKLLNSICTASNNCLGIFMGWEGRNYFFELAFFGKSKLWQWENGARL